MKIKYSTIAMSRNKNSSFRTAERVWKTLFKANVTVLLLVLIKNVNISRLNRIGRQLQPVELAAGELAVNWQTTSAWLSLARVKRQHHNSTIDEPNEALSGGGGGHVTVFYLFSVAVAVLTHLCVICHYFSCPMPLLHGLRACRNLPYQSLPYNDKWARIQSKLS